MDKKYVREIMMGNVWTIKEDRPIKEAIEGMAKKNIGAVIVLDKDGHTTGIFTERDLLNRVASKGLSHDIPIREVMTRNLVCVQLHDEIATLPDIMIKGGFRHLPIIDGFEPVGILSMRDLMRHLKS